MTNTHRTTAAAVQLHLEIIAMLLLFGKQTAKKLIVTKLFAIVIKHLLNLLQFYCKIHFLRCQFSSLEWQFIAIDIFLLLLLGCWPICRCRDTFLLL